MRGSIFGVGPLRLKGGPEFDVWVDQIIDHLGVLQVVDYSWILDVRRRLHHVDVLVTSQVVWNTFLQTVTAIHQVGVQHWFHQAIVQRKTILLEGRSHNRLTFVIIPVLQRVFLIKLGCFSFQFCHFVGRELAWFEKGHLLWELILGWLTMNCRWYQFFFYFFAIDVRVLSSLSLADVVVVHTGLDNILI